MLGFFICGHLNLISKPLSDWLLNRMPAHQQFRVILILENYQKIISTFPQPLAQPILFRVRKLSLEIAIASRVTFRYFNFWYVYKERATSFFLSFVSLFQSKGFSFLGIFKHTLYRQLVFFSLNFIYKICCFKISQTWPS